MQVNFSDKKVIRTKNSIFIAGPTHRKNLYSGSYRNDAVNFLDRIGFDGVVYIPDFEEGKLSQYEKDTQMEWEWEALHTAGCIMFWIPRSIENEMPGFTTNIEFGTYLQERPEAIVYGRPDEAEKMEYLDWLWIKVKGKEARIYNDLHQTCRAAIECCKRNV